MSSTNGIKVFNSAGVLTYSTDDVTWNQVDFFQVQGGTSSQRNYPVILGREVLLIQLMINPPPLDRKAIAHDLSVSGTTVTVVNGSEAAYVLVMMR